MILMMVGRSSPHIWLLWWVMAPAFFFGMIGGLGIPHLKCSVFSYMRGQMTRKLCISDLLGHQEDGSNRFWNLRFYRNFHERELKAAFSFLDFIQSRIPRGIGCDNPHWCLNGNGKFDIRSFYKKIRGTSLSSFP